MLEFDLQLQGSVQPHKQQHLALKLEDRTDLTGRLALLLCGYSWPPGPWEEHECTTMDFSSAWPQMHTHLLADSLCTCSPGIADYDAHQLGPFSNCSVDFLLKMPYLITCSVIALSISYQPKKMNSCFICYFSEK